MAKASRNWSAALSSVLLGSVVQCTCHAASAVAADGTLPSTIYVLRIRASYNETASKFIYLGNYNCFLSKYWAELAEPEPMRTEHAKARALASAPPVSTYSAADEGDVKEYFAPGRYARYERSTSFLPAQRGACALVAIAQTKVQIAQGNRVVNAITKNGVTTLSEVPVPPYHQPTAQNVKHAEAALTQLARTWGGGMSPGTVGNVGEMRVAGEICNLLTSSAPTFGTAVDLCVWRGMKSFLTPLGPREIVLFSETRAPAGTKPMPVTDPIVLNTADVLHWTERAQEFHLNESFAETIFTPPQPTIAPPR